MRSNMNMMGSEAIKDFASRHMGEYKIRGSEIIPTYCPICKGNGRDKHSFAINIDTGAYNCKRGSCGVSGSFNQLKKEFGEGSDSKEFMPGTNKPFKKPKTVPQTPSQKIAGYLEGRGISRETWESRGVGESGGRICFPYKDEKGEITLVKFRDLEGKWTREPGGKAIFWGMDSIKGQNLLISEGEMDCLTLIEAGIDNSTTIPSGAGDLTCVEHCWDWLKQFKYIYIWPDNDEPGREMCKRLVRKLGEYRCYIIQSEYKDANEVLLNEGVPGIARAISAAKEVPIAGLTRLAEVQHMDLKKLERVSTGFHKLDRILGGAYMGFLSVWTGHNSSGKSTLLGQVLAESIEAGYKVCAYSGELPASMYRYWVDLQFAGPSNLEGYFDDFRNEMVYFVPSAASEKIREWYKHKYFFHEKHGASTEDDILEIFKYASMRYNCKTFLVDNMMTTVLSTQDDNFYRRQSAFIGRLADFAKQYESHVHVVAHPRKASGRLTKMDVSGSGDITNRADNVISVHRIKDEERYKLGDFQDCAAIVDVFKNRLLGKQELFFGLDFEPNSKRFYCPENGGKSKKYGWEVT